MKEDLLKELAALLEKYNVTIVWNCSDCSDLHGVYDRRMEITDPMGNVIFASIDGDSISVVDLNEILEQKV